MSTAKKMTTIAENTPKVYNQGYEDGKNSVVDYLQSAKTVQFNSLNVFGKADVELNLDKCTTLQNFCNVGNTENKNITVEHLTIKNAIPTDMRAFLSCGYAYRDETLKRVTLYIDSSNVTTFQDCFGCLIALEIIDGNPLDLSAVNTASTISLSNVFNYNLSLKEVRFVANSIPKSLSFYACQLLSDETIQSIRDGLADLTGGTAQTLTVHKTVYEKIIANGWDALITAKNWILVSA